MLRHLVHFLRNCFDYCAKTNKRKLDVLLLTIGSWDCLTDKEIHGKLFRQFIH